MEIYEELQTKLISANDQLFHARDALFTADAENKRLREALINIECDSRGMADGYVKDLDSIKSRSKDIYNMAKQALSRG